MASTEYTLQLTVCAPLDDLDDANQLALIVGESAADVNTFTAATHTKDGVEYACISTVAKPVVASYTGGLPHPEHAQGADHEAAMRAMQAATWDLRERGQRPSEILAELGFEVIVVDDGAEE